jgi:hypothetical protein
VEVFSEWSRDYPFQDVAELARQAVDKGIDVFHGRLDKSVVFQGSKELDPDSSDKCRAKMVEECAAGRAYGPYSECPWRHARICPIFAIPKNKHTPEDGEIRLISHFSKGGKASINSLCYTPRLLGFHCRAEHIRDRIARCGKGAMVYATDIPKCFRRQRVLEKLLPLFVYAVVTQKYGKELFVDCSTPFGWSSAEWRWQTILAILECRFTLMEREDILAYVDNFFDINSAMAQAAFDARCTKLDAIFAAVGLVMHEHQKGTQFKGLGWQWDTVAMTMECPLEKFDIVCRYVTEWNAAGALTCHEWEKAAGILYWLTACFKVCRAAVSYIIHDRTRAQMLTNRCGKPRHRVVVKKSKESSTVFRLLARVLPRWDRTCPVVEGFTPTATWEMFGRVDASTDWGCGGF